MTHSVEDVRKLLNVLASQLVAIPDAVIVEAVETVDGILLKLRVAPSDVGMVIGLRGHTARSLRTILAALGARANLSCFLEIFEEE